MARVVVVGGGFGGLATALRLAKLGHEVTLVEERALGGALAPVTRDGFAWDTATYTLVPGVVRDLFRKTGRPLERELDLVQLDCLREHWFDGRDVAGAHRAPGRAARGVRPAPPRARSRPGSTTWRRTATTGRCCAGSTPRCPGTPTTCRSRWRALLGSRESLARRLRKVSRDERLGLVAGHPFTADGHALRDVPAWAGVTSYLEQRFGAWAFVGGTAALRDALVARLDTRRVTVVAARVDDVVVRAGTGGRGGDDGRRARRGRRGLRRRPAAPAGPGVVRRPGRRRCCRRRPATSAWPARCPTCLTSWSCTATRRSWSARCGRGPDGHHAWTVHGRGPGRRGPARPRWRGTGSTSASRSSPGSTSPRATRWTGGVARPGACSGRVARPCAGAWGRGPRSAGVYAAGAHAAPGSGLPFVGLSAALVAQVVGPA